MTAEEAVSAVGWRAFVERNLLLCFSVLSDCSMLWWNSSHSCVFKAHMLTHHIIFAMQESPIYLSSKMIKLNSMYLLQGGCGIWRHRKMLFSRQCHCLLHYIDLDKLLVHTSSSIRAWNGFHLHIAVDAILWWNLNLAQCCGTWTYRPYIFRKQGIVRSKFFAPVYFFLAFM